MKWPFLALIGGGVAVGSATGLVGYLDGSFLAPISFEVFGSHQTTSLVFDLGVYLAVVGMVLTAINMLGGVQEPGSPDAPMESDSPPPQMDPEDELADAAPSAQAAQSEGGRN